MSGPSENTDMFAVIDGTWPAERYETCGPWTLRVGHPGISRVTAATLSTPTNGPIDSNDLDLAEDGMQAQGQRPLFMIRDGKDSRDKILDIALEVRGYTLFDPVQIYTCPVEHLTDIALPKVTVFTIWKPLAIMREIWAEGDIGPERQAIMDRVAGPKVGILARHRDKPGGAAFIAIHDGICMLHALEIPPHQRKQGLGGWMMRGAAFWAAEQGAHTMSVMCTRANTGANALYSSLGMDVVGQYHYRKSSTETEQT